MNTVQKLVAALVVVTVAVGVLAVVAGTDEPDREVVALQKESAPGTQAPGSGAGGSVEADDRPLWPEEERRARAAALAVTGGGAISELDRSDDPGESYEVEVIKSGREYDIALDLHFRPVPNRRYDD